MKARRLWVTGPLQVSVQSVELPDAPEPGCVLLETERTLMSAGTELAIVMGTHIGFTTGASWPKYPMELGYTAIGRVLRVGDGVTEVREGDRVLAATRHATHAIAEARSLIRVPDRCPADAALLANLAQIPLSGVRRAGVTIGTGMIVFGQGLIGALAARLGRFAGCRPVLGVDPLAERRAVASAAGIVAVDPNVGDPGAVFAERAHGRAPEVVIEATGVPAVINEALRVVGSMGRVVLLGSPRGRVEIDPYTDVHAKGITIVGAHNRWTPLTETPQTPFTRDRDRQLLVEIATDGSLPMDGLVTHHVAPEEAGATYCVLAESRPEYLGVVIRWQD